MTTIYRVEHWEWKQQQMNVWTHPHAQATLDGLNRYRIATGLRPLTREQATEAIRQQLAKNEWERRTIESEVAREQTRKFAIRLINAGYKALAKEHHPDMGGSHENMARLVGLRDVLLANHKLPRLPRWLRQAVNKRLRELGQK
jgi:hypothetical protein